MEMIVTKFLNRSHDFFVPLNLYFGIGSPDGLPAAETRYPKKILVTSGSVFLQNKTEPRREGIFISTLMVEHGMQLNQWPLFVFD